MSTQASLRNPRHPKQPSSYKSVVEPEKGQNIQKLVEGKKIIGQSSNKTETLKRSMKLRAGFCCVNKIDKLL